MFNSSPIYLALLFGFSLQAQTSSLSRRDSFIHVLEQYEHQDSFEAYYKQVVKLDHWCFDTKNYKQIVNNGSYFNRLPQNQKDSLAYRKATMYHAHNLKKGVGDINSALDYYILAHKHGKTIGYDDKYTWYIENPLGSIYARLNNFDLSLYYYSVCTATKQGQKYLSRLYKNMGSAYFWLEDLDKAIEYLNRASEIAYSKNNFIAIQSIHLQLAEIHLSQNHLDYFLDDYSLSKKALTNISMSEKLIERKASLESIFGDYLVKKGQYNEAIKSYRRSIRYLESDSSGNFQRGIAKKHGKISSCYLNLKMFKLCNEEILKGYKCLIPSSKKLELPRSIDVYNENTFSELLEIKARYYYERNYNSLQVSDIDSALMACDLALHINDEILSSLKKNSTKYQTIGYSRDIVNAAVKFSYKAYQITSNKDYNRNILKYFNRSKGVVLEEISSRNKQKKKINEVQRDSINRIEADIVNYLGEHVPTEKDRRKHLNNIENLNAIYNSLGEEIYKSKTGINSYIEYLICNNEIFVYTDIGEEKLLKLSVTSEELQIQISSLTEKIKEKNSDNLNELLETLYKNLIPFPLEGVEKLTIIPDGYICNIPFDLLRCNDKYLIELMPISYNFQNKETVANNNLNSEIKAFCLFPDYTEMRNEQNRLPQLHHSNSERDAIRSISKIGVTGSDVSNIKELKKKLIGNNIFHFGGHAVAKNNSSYLVLVDSSGMQEKMYSTQIEYMENELDLVCLSACETGVGKMIYGEGIISLATSFFRAGANSVVYSLWPVNDKSTSELISAFYKKLAKGERKDEALRNAKLNYLNTSSPIQKHPYYWSAFCLVGSPDSVVKNEFNYNYIIFIIFILAIITLIKIKAS